MMGVRRRTWTTLSGEKREAWIARYTDGAGVRRVATFARKKDADAYQAAVQTAVRSGAHVAPSISPSMVEVAENWLTYVELEGRERSTLAQYRQHVELHILPRLGHEKLAALTTPRINAFRDELAHWSVACACPESADLHQVDPEDAQRRGHVAQNVARDVRIGVDKRGKRKLKVGTDIPTPQEIGRILHATTGKWRPILVTDIFTGLRSSELRGLRWADIDLKRGLLHVRQRADRYGAIGSPKSEAGERTIPLGPFVLNVLREWRLICPAAALGLVFPTRSGRIIRHENIVRYALGPTQVAAGVVNASGECKYPGLHALRHFYASWLINRKVDGGLALPLKVVSERLGHASIVITTDTYGHLFPDGDDGDELAAAERALIGLHAT
jgi:integrase